MLAVGYDVSNHPANHRVGEEDEECEAPQVRGEDNVNTSSFDLTIDSVDVTLSLWRWLDGKGLVENAVVRGVRGVLGSFCDCKRFIYTTNHGFRSSHGALGPRKPVDSG